LDWCRLSVLVNGNEEGVEIELEREEEEQEEGVI